MHESQNSLTARSKAQTLWQAPTTTKNPLQVTSKKWNESNVFLAQLNTFTPKVNLSCTYRLSFKEGSEKIITCCKTQLNEVSLQACLSGNCFGECEICVN